MAGVAEHLELQAAVAASEAARAQRARDALLEASGKFLEETAEPVPSGYVFMDGRWQDPTTLELIEVLRDGLLIKRRHVDLLPYDELVVLP